LTVYSVIDYPGDETIDPISPDYCWKIGLKRSLSLSFKPERRQTMDLHYEVQGKGEAVVLIHSGGADLRDWELIAPQLAQTYQVITFDGRGAGQSPPLLEPANYVEDLRQLLDHLHLDRVILVGHSIGGQIATDFALAYPDRVTSWCW
jgi:pimeloyl-ACP methyl ester carboxylesterase